MLSWADRCEHQDVGRYGKPDLGLKHVIRIIFVSKLTGEQAAGLVQLGESCKRFSSL